MIWLTLRQFRLQALVALGALAAVAALLAFTHVDLADDYTNGIRACGGGDGCERFRLDFFNEHQTWFTTLVAVVVGLPALVGAFWGAPLITREIEAGTHRLAWNQSVSRTRWLAVKLGVVGLASMAAAGLAVAAATWWSDPLDKAATDRFPRLAPLMFDARGIAPIGYAAFAFVLGVTAGVLVRRTLPAMAITLAVFAGLQFAVPNMVRPHLMTPEERTVTITSENMRGISLSDTSLTVSARVDDPGAWVLSDYTVDPSGRKVKSLPVSLASGACAPPPPRAAETGGERPDGKRVADESGRGPAEKCYAEIARLGYRQHVTYHPANRFWTLQWAETGLFALLSAGLTGFCFYWVRRRLS
ncbi:ABC transporter permease subunit [Actinomadura terrae]|uniref:ABC transporter permease subunit n=1 Tax=Actinomadura terrae TaxID=604353 RepID=UPI001FA79B7D|nr:ABC transporter permease subunit [Actinomadura terrae]